MDKVIRIYLVVGAGVGAGVTGLEVVTGGVTVVLVVMETSHCGPVNPGGQPQTWKATETCCLGGYGRQTNGAAQLTPEHGSPKVYKHTLHWSFI